MKKVKLVGTFMSDMGGTAGRVFDCNVTLMRGNNSIESNIEIDVKLTESLWQIKTLVDNELSKFDAKIQNWGIKLDVHADFSIERIEDVSYGLPIYTALLSEALELDIRSDLCGTGQISESGSVLPVGKIE